MARTILQTVTFAAPPSALFELYLDSKKHTAATGGRASISRKVGGRFSAWDGYITGRNLEIVPNRRIVQTWRGSDWRRSDPDSILVLAFSTKGQRGEISLVHVLVPEDQYAPLRQGWSDHYWTPWKAYLRRGKTRG